MKLLSLLLVACACMGQDIFVDDFSEGYLLNGEFTIQSSIVLSDAFISLQGNSILGGERDIYMAAEIVDIGRGAGDVKTLIQTTASGSSDSNAKGTWIFYWDGVDGSVDIQLGNPIANYSNVCHSDSTAAIRILVTGTDICHDEDVTIFSPGGQEHTESLEVGFHLAGQCFGFPPGLFDNYEYFLSDYTNNGVDVSQIQAIRISVDTIAQNIEALDFVWEFVKICCCRPEGDTTSCDDGDPQTVDTCDGCNCINNRFVSVDGTVILDVDGDCQLDGGDGDRVFPDVTVFLYYDADGDTVLDPAEEAAPVANTTTDANGYYLFEDVPAGNYFTIAVTPLPEDDWNNEVVGYADAQSGNGNIAQPLCLQPLIDYEVNVWSDTENCQYDDTVDTILPSVNVCLAQTAPIARQINCFNTLNGKVVFADLTLGTYEATITVPNGYVLPPGLTNTDVKVGDDAGDLLVSDFCLFAVAAIGDYVWRDLNNDNMQPGENGIDDVTLLLCLDDNNDGAYQANTETTCETEITAGGGDYLFTDLQPFVRYFVVVDEDSQALDGMQNTGSGVVHTVQPNDLPPGTTYRLADFGFNLGSIEGTVFSNPDGNCGVIAGRLQGVDVELFTSSTCTDAVDTPNTPFRTRSTDAQGEYVFNDLPVGCYVVSIDGADQTLPVVNSLFFEGDPSDVDNDVDSLPVVQVGAPSPLPRVDQDFCYDPLVEVSGRVWNEDDSDCTYAPNSGDVPFADQTVCLNNDQNGNGVIDLPNDSVFSECVTVNSLTGTYVFTGLVRDDYVVSAGPDAGFALAVDLNGPEEFGIDSGARFGSYTLAADANAGDSVDNDFCLEELASIGDLVWHDDDRQNDKDPSEGVFPDVTVLLFADTDDSGAIDGTEATTPVETDQTGPQGLYLFDGLKPNRLYEVVLGPDNFLPGGELRGLLFTGPDETIEYTPDPGEDYRDADFGFDFGDITGIVVSTTNPDNCLLATPTGTLLDGISVQLLLDTDPNCQGSDQVVAPPDVDVNPAVTAADGSFAFGMLREGCYTLRINGQQSVKLDYLHLDGDPTDPDSDIDVIDEIQLQTTVTNFAEVENFCYVSLIDISGTVWSDVDGNCENTAPGDAELNDFTVCLLLDLNGNGQINLGDREIDCVTTDPQGRYSFLGHSTENTYQVHISIPDEYSTSPGFDAIDRVVDAGTIAPVTDVDFCLAELATVGDLVWHDDDRDGVKDPDEGPIPNVDVLLCEDLNQDGIPQSGEVSNCERDTTDVNGLYLFENVEPNADYFVYPDPLDPDLDGWLQITPTPYLTGTLSPGEDHLTADFGYDLIDIEGTIWSDAGSNCVLGNDVADQLLPNVNVCLYKDVDGNGLVDSPSDSVVQCVQTLADGTFIFENVPLGTYTVNADTPTGSDLAVDPADTDFVEYNNGDRYAVPVDATVGNTDGSDFCFERTASIGDLVWLDLDKDDNDDLNEDGIPGVTVTLVEDLNDDGVIDTDERNSGTTQVTDEDGLYLFEDLTPNRDYEVNLDSPANYLPGAPLEGLLYTGNTDPHVVDDLLPSQSYLDADFGFVFGLLRGTVYQNDDDNCVPTDSASTLLEGVVVDVEKVDCTTGASLGQSFQATTDVNGEYEVPGLRAGCYQASVDGSQAGPLVGLSFDDILDPDNDVDYLDPVELGDLQTVASFEVEDQDFCYKPNGSIGDLVYRDTTGNCDESAGTNTPLAGVEVELHEDADCNGNFVLLKSTTTDPSGLYLFTGLIPVCYQVRINRMHANTDLQVLFFENTDDGARVDSSSTVQLTPGEEYLDADMCYVPKTPLSDIVYYDFDGDCEKNGDDTFAPGVKINICSITNIACDGRFSDTTTTDANGRYTFDDLLSGVYRVTVDTSDPDTQTILAGTEWMDAAPADARIVDLRGLEAVDEIIPTDETDFCYQPQLDIFGAVFTDLIGDCEYTEGGPDNDVPLTGGEVCLYTDEDLNGVLDGADIQVLCKPSGVFEFLNVPVGEYRVEATHPNFPLQRGALVNLIDGVTLFFGPVRQTEVSLLEWCYIPPVSIGNFVWDDLDDDDEQDGNEPGLPGITLSLSCDQNGDGDFNDPGESDVERTVTAVDGSYLFDDLLPNKNYEVDVIDNERLVGFRYTGSDKPDFIPKEDLPPSTNYPDADFGFVREDCCECLGVIECTTIVYYGAGPVNVDIEEVNGGGVVLRTETLDTGEILEVCNANPGFMVVCAPDKRAIFATVCDNNPHEIGDIVGDFEILARTSTEAGNICPPGKEPEDNCPVECCECLGVVTEIQFLNNGPTAPVDVQGGGNTLFTGTVQAGALFTVNVPGVDSITINPGNVEIPTSCTPPISKLENFGDYQVWIASSSIGGEICGPNDVAQLDCPLIADLGDEVYRDVTGVCNPDDDITNTPLAGVQVDLYRDEDCDPSTTPTLLRSTTTDADGMYLFKDLFVDSCYVVGIMVANSLVVLDGLYFENDVLASDDMLPMVTLPFAGDMDQDFCYTPNGDIGGDAFLDFDGDCTEDGNDLPREGVKLDLCLDNDAPLNECDGAILESTRTGPDGAYLFENLLSGVYLVVVDMSDPATQTALQSTIWSDDPPASERRVDLTALNTQNEQEDLDNDFCYQPLVDIGDEVYRDVTANCDPTAGTNTPLAGVQVDLYANPICNPNAVPGAPIDNTVTDNNGKYVFEDRKAGCYFVGIDGSPSGPNFALLGELFFENTDQGVLVILNTVGIAAGEEDMDQDFCYVPNGDIGGDAFVDFNGNCDQDGSDVLKEGVKVDICHDVDAPLNECDSPPFRSERTGPDGMYLFDNLLSGQYLVVVDFTDTDTVEILLGTEWSDGPPPSERWVDLTALETDDVVEDLDNDFCYQPLGNIGDFVYRDTTANCNPDADTNEPLDGIVVFLFDNPTCNANEPVGEPIRDTTTDADGLYRFEFLEAGCYLVGVDAEANDHELDNLRFENRLDKKVNVILPMIVLQAAQDRLDQDFCYVPSGDITGDVFIDLNGDCEVHDNDLMIENVKLDLCLDNNEPHYECDGAVLESTRTAIDGGYEFLNLLRGEYLVVVDMNDAATSALLAGLQWSDDPPPGVRLVPELAALDEFDYVIEFGVDFCYEPRVDIRGMVFIDNDSDCVLDAEDLVTSLPDIICLYTDSNLNNIIDEDDHQVGNCVSTGQDGTFLFEDILAGNYQVKATAPDGYLLVPVPAAQNSFTVEADPASQQTEFEVPSFCYERSVTIGDLVFADADINGVYDAGERGFEGVELVLSVDKNGDGDFDDPGESRVYTEETNSVGLYLFEDLHPNRAYLVEVIDDVGEIGEFHYTGEEDKKPHLVPKNELPPGTNYPDADFGYAIGDCPERPIDTCALYGVCIPPHEDWEFHGSDCGDIIEQGFRYVNGFWEVFAESPDNGICCENDPDLWVSFEFDVPTDGIYKISFDAFANPCEDCVEHAVLKIDTITILDVVNTEPEHYRRDIYLTQGTHTLYFGLVVVTELCHEFFSASFSPFSIYNSYSHMYPYDTEYCNNDPLEIYLDFDSSVDLCSHIALVSEGSPDGWEHLMSYGPQLMTSDYMYTIPSWDFRYVGGGRMCADVGDEPVNPVVFPADIAPAGNYELRFYREGYTNEPVWSRHIIMKDCCCYGMEDGLNDSLQSQIDLLTNIVNELLECTDCCPPDVSWTTIDDSSVSCQLLSISCPSGWTPWSDPACGCGCRPTECGCPDVMDPVCGVDGNVYDNECLAACAGVDVGCTSGSCPCPDIDCVFSWGDFSPCSALCQADGAPPPTMYRDPIITTEQSGNGNSCPPREERECNVLPCVDCEFQWGNFSPCSMDCQIGDTVGTQTREPIISVHPIGGVACPSSETRDCNVGVACLDCEYTWDDYSACSEPCQSGPDLPTQFRDPLVTQFPTGDGMPCPERETRVCNVGVECPCTCDGEPLSDVCGVDGVTYQHACDAGCAKVDVACDQACPCPPVDCVYTWDDWSDCSAECQLGSTAPTRSRDPIVTVLPAFGGAPCPGTEFEDCNTTPCPQNDCTRDEGRWQGPSTATNRSIPTVEECCDYCYNFVDAATNLPCVKWSFHPGTTSVASCKVWTDINTVEGSNGDGWVKSIRNP